MIKTIPGGPKLAVRVGGISVLALVVGLPAILSAQATNHQAERSPKQIYESTCGYCHGRNVGPIIRGRKLPAETVKYFVRNGPNAMPAFRPTEITDAELDRLAAWILESKVDPGEKGQ